MGQGIQKRVRAEYHKTVFIHTRFKTIEAARSDDISLNGIFVHSEDKLKKGSRCDLEMFLSPSITLHMRGIVVRSTKEGMGITFTCMDDATLFHLKNIVLYNTQNPIKFLDECQKNPGFK